MKKNKCYIIAEIGGNFTNFADAKRLINLAKKTGVDAVKLQTYNADTLASKKAKFDMQNTGKISQYELFKKFQIKILKENFYGNLNLILPMELKIF